MFIKQCLMFVGNTMLKNNAYEHYAYVVGNTMLMNNAYEHYAYVVGNTITSHYSVCEF